VRGVQIELTPTEFNLLVYLMEHASKVLPHQTILQHVWVPNMAPSTNTCASTSVACARRSRSIQPIPIYLITERGLAITFEA